MATIDEQNRTCSHCGGAPFPTQEAFSQHWNACPTRVAAGYIPLPLERIPAVIRRLRKEAKKLLTQADALEGRLTKAR